VAKVADLLTMENMLSDESEMDEETHRVKQYESSYLGNQSQITIMASKEKSR
jgi:hypothetical protein